MSEEIKGAIILQPGALPVKPSSKEWAEQTSTSLIDSHPQILSEEDVAELCELCKRLGAAVNGFATLDLTVDDVLWRPYVFLCDSYRRVAKFLERRGIEPLYESEEDM